MCSPDPIDFFVLEDHKILYADEGYTMTGIGKKAHFCTNKGRSKKGCRKEGRGDHSENTI